MLTNLEKLNLKIAQKLQAEEEEEKLKEKKYNVIAEEDDLEINPNLEKEEK